MIQGKRSSKKTEKKDIEWPKKVADALKAPRDCDGWDVMITYPKEEGA